MLWSNLFTTQLWFNFFTPPCRQEGQNPPIQPNSQKAVGFLGAVFLKPCFTPQFLALIHDPVFWYLRTHSQPGSLPCHPAQIEPGLCLTPASRLWCLLWQAATSCVPHHSLAPSPLPCPWNEWICTPLVPDLAYSQPCPRPNLGATPSPTTLIPDHRVFLGISEPLSAFWLMVSCHEDKQKSSSTGSIPTAHGAPRCLQAWEVYRQQRNNTG